MGSMDQGSVENMSFGVYKKNARGRYQNRKLHFDFVAQQVTNVSGESSKASSSSSSSFSSSSSSFPFPSLSQVTRDPDNPLSFLLAFRDSNPFHIYARSRRDADLMVETIEKIIENNKTSTETQVYHQFVEMKRGYVMQKVQLTFQRRWLVLHRWQLTIKREDSDQHPSVIRPLYNVPLAKYTDKQENGQLAHFISVLFDDDQFTFRFETPELRDQWFAALLNASQDERSLSTIPPERREMRTKSKEQVRAEQELEALRAERIHVAKSDTEGKDERHRLAIIVDELKSRCAATENEVQRLSLSMSIMDEEQKQIEEDIKKHERNIKDDDAKKIPLEAEIVQLQERITEIKHEITKADIEIKLKESDTRQLDHMDDTEVVKRKRAVNSALNEGEQKIAGLKLVREETLKKSDSKMQRMHLLEKLIGDMVGEVKALAAEKETQLENCSKKEKEQTDVLGMQKNTIVSRLKELDVELANSKEAYDAAIAHRNFLMDELEEMKATEALLIGGGDDDDSEAGGSQRHLRLPSPRRPLPLLSSPSPSSSPTSSPTSPANVLKKSKSKSTFSSPFGSPFSSSPSFIRREVRWGDASSSSPPSHSSAGVATSAVPPTNSTKK